MSEPPPSIQLRRSTVEITFSAVIILDVPDMTLSRAGNKPPTRHLAARSSCGGFLVSAAAHRVEVRSGGPGRQVVDNTSSPMVMQCGWVDGVCPQPRMWSGMAMAPPISVSSDCVHPRSRARRWSFCGRGRREQSQSLSAAASGMDRRSVTGRSCVSFAAFQDSLWQ